MQVRWGVTASWTRAKTARVSSKRETVWKSSDETRPRLNAYFLDRYHSPDVRQLTSYNPLFRNSIPTLDGRQLLGNRRHHRHSLVNLPPPTEVGQEILFFLFGGWSTGVEACVTRTIEIERRSFARSFAFLFPPFFFFFQFFQPHMAGSYTYESVAERFQPLTVFNNDMGWLI